jgi:hypothetical protein
VKANNKRTYRRQAQPQAQSRNGEIRARFHATYPVISEETVIELSQRGLLQLDVGHWRFGDNNNGCTRRVDGANWKRADNKGSDWHKLIGLADTVRHDHPLVLLAIEGSKDALALAEIAHRFGLLDQTGIVCALGSGYRPDRHPHEIEQLRGRRVSVIGDKDVGAQATTELVRRALAQAEVEHEVWDWAHSGGFTRAKDAYDLLAELDQAHGERVTFKPVADWPLFRALARACAPAHGSGSARSHVHSQTRTRTGSARPAVLRVSKKTFLFCPSPSENSTVQPFNPSTQEICPVGITAEEALGIVCPFIVTQRGTGNRQSFLLARAIKPRKLTCEEIDRVVLLWFEKSRPMLPAKANYQDTLEKFYRQLTRVRFTESGLEAARERAESADPPLIPARDGDVRIAKLAAFCRELQRNAGKRAFICPVNIAQRFLALPRPAQAAWLLHVLEEEGVLECIDRGAPNKAGERGKPTLWRYLYPM